MKIGITIVGKKFPPKYYEEEDFSPSILLNKADEIASVLDYGMMVKDIVMGYHWLRVYFQRGTLDIKADDWETRSD